MKVVGERKKLKKDEKETKETRKNMFDTLSEDTNMDVTSKESKEAMKNSKLPSLTGKKRNGADPVLLNGEYYSEDELVITAEDKSKFIDSLISGERYKQTGTLFGGKVNFVIRNRTTDETQALYAFMRHELSKSDKNVSLLDGDMSYILLVAQIDELNGTKFPEMKSPLNFLSSGGKEEAPGWYQDLIAWKSKPEGLTGALIKKIQLFEYKYWTMVNEASNKNFWNSDTSIVK